MNRPVGRVGPWFRRYRNQPEAVARLVTFPHAGGGASFFRRWLDRLPMGIDLLSVQYPGREDRLSEELRTDLRAMASDIATALTAHRDLPLALFGHSLGAAVAYEVAVRLQTGGMEPRLLAVSGRSAPIDTGRDVHRRSDDELWAEVCSAGGTDPALLAAPEVKAMLMPVLRSDYRLSETYRPGAMPQLTTPVLVCAGETDPDVDTGAAMAWREVTHGSFDLRVFPGHHFYLIEQCPAVVAAVVTALEDAGGIRPWPPPP